MTEVQQLEQLMNEMLPGLQLFARDINLTPEEASKFQSGQIVRNRRLYRCDESCGRHGDNAPFQHFIEPPL